MDIMQEGVSVRGPKNKKQIGCVGKGDKIYIEDYAVTYLNQIARAPETKNGFAGLFGTYREVEGIKEYYIYAAIYQEYEPMHEGKLPRDAVQKIIRQKGEFFSEFYFLGWALIYSERNGMMWENCYRSRMETTVGMPDLLMTLQCNSCEEYFYLYPTEMPKQVEGYFIFYEQNDAMQNFLIEWHGENHRDKSNEEGDLVAKSCRNYYKEKKAKQFRARLTGVAMIASAILLIFALGTSIQEMNGYDKIQSVGQNIDAEAVNTSSADEDDLVPIQWEEEKVTGEGSETLLYENALSEGAGQTSEKTAVENIVETSENVAVESIGTDSKFVTNESSMPETEIVTQESEVQVEEVVLTEYVTYEVAKGDTLYGICVRFYGNLQRAEEVCEINHINDMDNILYGQKILLPR